MLCQSIFRILCLILSLLDFEIVGKDSTEQQLYLHLHSHRQLQGLLKRPTVSRYPHWKSPSNGTDIVSSPISILRCTNQTTCIHPAFQLQVQYKIYLCRHINFGIRFYYLVREGLLLHPNVVMVDDMDQSDFIVYLPGSSAWEKSECSSKRFIQLILNEMVIFLYQGLFL